MERENSDLSSTLVKTEQDLEAKAQEKEDLQSNLERAKEKLELELQRANEARHRLGQMDNHVVHSGGVHQAKKVKPEKVTEFELNQRHRGGIWREI